MSRLLAGLFCVWTLSAQAQPSATIGSVAVETGTVDTVNVPVTFATDGATVLGFDFSLVYDTSELTFTACTSSLTTCAEIGSPGTIDIVNLSSQGDALIATLTFDVTGAAPGTYPILVSGSPAPVYTDGALMEQSLTVVAGSVTIEPNPPRLSLENRTALAGETVTIGLDYAGESASVVGLQASINFDAALVTPDITNCGPSGDFQCSIVGSQVRIAGFGLTLPVLLDGSLGSIDFAVNGAASAFTETDLFLVDVEFSDRMAEAITPFEREHGSIGIVDSATPRIDVGTELIVAGVAATVDVPLTLDPGSFQVDSTVLELSFDADELAFVSCSIAGSLAACSENEPGILRIVSIGLGASEPLDLGTIRFDTSTAAVATYAIDASPTFLPDGRDAINTPTGLVITPGAVEVSLGAQIGLSRDAASIAADATDDVGNVNQGTATLTYDIENIGGDDLLLNPPTASNLVNVRDFVVQTPPAGSLAPMATTSTVVAFEVIGPGSFSFDLSIDSNDVINDPFDITVTGVGTGPDIDIQRPAGTDNSIPSGGTDDVGNRAIGTVNLTYTVANTGNENLSVGATPTAANLGNVENFVVNIGPASPVLPAQSTTFEISFDVITNGPFGLDLLVASSDPDEDPYVVSLAGTGIGGNPEIDVQRPSGTSIADGGSDDIGFVPAGANSLTYTVTSSGNVPLQVALPVITNVVNAANVIVAVPPASQVDSGAQTSFELDFDVDTVGPFSFDVSIGNNDANENPYDFTVTGAVPDVQLSAELEQPLLLVDNDADGDPNPSDTIRFRVRLNNDGELAAGGTTFSFTAPAGVTIADAGFDGSLSNLNPVLTSDATTISATFTDVPGGGANFSEIVSFDLLIDNDTVVDAISLQGSFDYEGSTVLTDDPAIPGAEDPTLVPIGRLNRLVSPDTAQDFGQSTSLSDEFVAIGSPGDNGGSGTVSIYRIRADGQREFLTRIDPPPGFGGSGFGVDVSLDGDVLLVGSTDTGTAPKGATGTKAAVFQLFGGVPQLVTQITANLDSGFGASVDLVGDTVVVGAPLEDEGSAVDSGAVYTFSLNALVSGSTEPALRLTARTPQAQGQFGAALACADGKIVIGAPGPVGAALAGGASIYDMLTANLADISAPFDGAGEFGAAVAIEGDRVVIGSPAAPGGGGVFEFDPSGQVIGSRIISGDAAGGDGFGRAVALEGGQLWVGAPNSLVPGLVADGNFGAVYRFDESRIEMQKVGAFSESSGTFEQQDGFGSALSVEGSTILIGAPRSQDSRGAAAYQRGDPKVTVFGSGFECLSLLGCEGASP